jgi:predicted transcriptional regulator
MALKGAEDGVAKAVMSRPPNDVLRAQLEALMERGVTDRERFAKHAGVKDSALNKFLSGQEINYHVRDQIEAEIANLADDAPEGRP